MKLGTPKENTNDALKENTLTLMGSGENNPVSKLKDKQVAEIIALKGGTLTQKEIAAMYGIHQSQVSRYWNKRTRKK